MAYKIRPYSLKRAEEIGVDLRSSIYEFMKIDVLDKKGKLICSIGTLGEMDYPELLEQRGEEAAQSRREQHREGLKSMKRLTPGWYYEQILW